MRDMHYNTTVLRAAFPVAVGTTGIAGGILSPVLDIRDADGVEIITLHATAGVTSDTTNLVVYESSTSDGSFTSVADADLLGTEAAAGLPAQASARTSGVGKNIARKVGYRGNKGFLKIRLYGLGHATGIAACAVLKHHLRRAPSAGSGSS